MIRTYSSVRRASSSFVINRAWEPSVYILPNDTLQGITHLEPCRLPVDAPDAAQRIADLAQRGLRPDRIQHGRNHVLRRPRDLHQVSDGGSDRGFVAGSLAGGQHRHLLPFDLVADPQDLQLAAHGLGVAVDTDHLLLALLQSDLIVESGVGDLGHEPAILDATKDAGRHGADWVFDRSVRARFATQLSHRPDLVED